MTGMTGLAGRNWPMPAVELWMHIMHANFVIYFVNNVMYICRLIHRVNCFKVNPKVVVLGRSC